MVSNRWGELLGKVRPYVPFTTWNTAWRSLDKRGKSILDLGCGKGIPMKFFNRHKQFHSVGADIFRLDVVRAKTQGTHDDYLLCDIQKLPIKTKSFDIVLCLETLEHLEKEEGERLLKEMEKIARKQIIISTPVGKFERPPTDGNTWQEHKSTYGPTELRAHDYQVKGYGLPIPGDDRGLIARLPEPFGSLRRFIWVLASVIT